MLSIEMTRHDARCGERVRIGIYATLKTVEAFIIAYVKTSRERRLA